MGNDKYAGKYKYCLYKIRITMSSKAKMVKY